MRHFFFILLTSLMLSCTLPEFVVLRQTALSPSATSDLEVPINPPQEPQVQDLTIEGTIAFPPTEKGNQPQIPENITVELLNQDGKRLQVVKTDARGQYRFIQVPSDGLYHLRAVAVENPKLTLETLLEPSTPLGKTGESFQKSISLRSTAMTLLRHLAQKRQSRLAEIPLQDLESDPAVVQQILEINQLLLDTVQKETPLKEPLSEKQVIRDKLTEALVLLEEVRQTLPTTLKNTPLSQPSPIVAWIAPNTAPSYGIVQIGISNAPLLQTDTLEIRFNGKDGQMAPISSIAHNGDLQIIRLSVPPKAESGPLYITTAGQVISGGEFTVIELPTPNPTPTLNISIDFIPQVIPQPTIETVNPTGGTYGDTIVLSGKGLDQINQLQINGTQAEILANTDGKIQFKIPTGATTGKITIQAPNAAGISPQNFTVIPNPYTFNGYISGLLGSDQVKITANNLTQTNLVTGNGNYSLSIPGQFPLPTLTAQWNNPPSSPCTLPPFLCPNPAPSWQVNYSISTSNVTFFTLSWPRLNFDNANLTVGGGQLTIDNANLLYHTSPASLYTITFPGGGLGTIASITETKIVVNIPGGAPGNGDMIIALPGQAPQTLKYPS